MVAGLCVQDSARDTGKAVIFECSAEFAHCHTVKIYQTLNFAGYRLRQSIDTPSIPIPISYEAHCCDVSMQLHAPVPNNLEPRCILCALRPAAILVALIQWVDGTCCRGWACFSAIRDVHKPSNPFHYGSLPQNYAPIHVYGK